VRKRGRRNRHRRGRGWYSSGWSRSHRRGSGRSRSHRFRAGANRGLCGGSFSGAGGGLRHVINDNEPIACVEVAAVCSSGARSHAIAGSTTAAPTAGTSASIITTATTWAASRASWRTNPKAALNTAGRRSHSSGTATGLCASTTTCGRSARTRSTSCATGVSTVAPGAIAIFVGPATSSRHRKASRKVRRSSHIRSATSRRGISIGRCTTSIESTSHTTACR